jgi:hypothetical protein
MPVETAMAAAQPTPSPFPTAASKGKPHKWTLLEHVPTIRVKMVSAEELAAVATVLDFSAEE